MAPRMLPTSTSEDLQTPAGRRPGRMYEPNPARYSLMWSALYPVLSITAGFVVLMGYGAWVLLGAAPH